MKEVFDREHRLWIEILKRSFEDQIVIKKIKQTSQFYCSWICVDRKKEQNEKEDELFDIRENDNLGGL